MKTLEELKKEYEKFSDKELRTIVKKADKAYDELKQTSPIVKEQSIKRQAARHILLRRVALRNNLQPET